MKKECIWAYGSEGESSVQSGGIAAEPEATELQDAGNPES